MAELTLEPYAVVQQWRLPGADGHWEVILAQYLQALAQGCVQAAPGAVIGHIKALALFPNQGYLRLSVVAPDIPASIEGQAPSGCTSLELTLNVLVYGLERSAIEQITEAASNDMARQWKGGVDHKKLHQARQPHIHHSNLQDKKERNDE